ncbi:PepSY domain-containing protein [Telmatospirillum siberiense]|uniref:PepSY domain-containing protein n=1 Tax=Telmatospirillum siberiense TaxID=382514 RepID=UPI00130470B3|nr:PepSY domain-containing protein [Telmatospirillum siberiense]
MSSKSSIAMAAVVVLAGLSLAPQFAHEAHASGCDANDKIDKSSADMARKAMAKAGYLQIHALKKGCDNFWHGQATRNGVAVRIVLSPHGQIETEGD